MLLILGGEREARDLLRCRLHHRVDHRWLNIDDKLEGTAIAVCVRRWVLPPRSVRASWFKLHRDSEAGVIPFLQ